MSKASTPVALRNSNGDLKRITVQEENYLAYKAGEKIASGANLGAILDTVTIGGTYDTVGTLTNTSYDDPVGSSSGTSLQVSTTTTTVYQKRGEGNFEQGASFRRPLVESDGSLYEMGAANFNELGQRLISIIETNEYPGAYRLATSSPGADWSTALSNVFTDTRTDGNSVSYTIYQKTGGTEPSGKNNPMYARKGTYGVGNTDYDGDLQAMTEAQIKETFGRIVAETFSAADGDIGSYQIRSSAQGAPTDAGTWVARGTATDTRNATQNQQYTRQYTGFSEVQYAGSRPYSNQYTGDRDFAGNRQFGGSRPYGNQYVGDRNFVGNRNFAGTRSFSGNRVINYPGFFNPPGINPGGNVNPVSPGNPFPGNPYPIPGNVNPGGNPYGPTPGNPFPVAPGVNPPGPGLNQGFENPVPGNPFPVAPGVNPPTPGGINPGGNVNPPSEGFNPPGVNPPTGGNVNPGGNPFQGFLNPPYNVNAPANFTGARTFTGERTFTGQRQFGGSRQYSNQYTRVDVDFTGQRQFAGSRQYSNQYANQYTDQYSNQYTGETIISSSQTIETYTLYVKVS